jgi:hypothetical protein
VKAAHAESDSGNVFPASSGVVTAAAAVVAASQAIGISSSEIERVRLLGGLSEDQSVVPEEHFVLLLFTLAARGVSEFFQGLFTVFGPRGDLEPSKLLRPTHHLSAWDTNISQAFLRTFELRLAGQGDSDVWQKVTGRSTNS